MATPPQKMDRRVQRTRALIQKAFKEVMCEKSFAATSIQDITDRANVNRGTFYAHFVDKYALLDSIIRGEFQALLASKLPPVDQWNRRTLQLLIQTVLEYFRRIQRECQFSDITFPLLERAAHEELTNILAAWLQQQQPGTARGRVPVATTANLMSWAIFGAATQWSRTTTTLSSEQMAHDVLLVLMEGVAGLIPKPVFSSLSVH